MTGAVGPQLGGGGDDEKSLSFLRGGSESSAGLPANFGDIFGGGATGVESAAVDPKLQALRGRGNDAEKLYAGVVNCMADSLRDRLNSVRGGDLDDQKAA